MSKFFKSLLLLLTAGLFTATGWAVLPEPWAEWTSFTSDTQSPTISKTINDKNGGNWTMVKSGGTRSDGLITTTVGVSSPYIDLMNDSADFGSNANPITLVATIELSETASSNSVQPLIVFDSWKASTTRALTLDLCGENGATFGAAKMQHAQDNYSIDNYDKEEETFTVSEIKPGVEVQIALFLSSEGLKLYTVSNNSATLQKTWANVTVANAETGRITFGGAHNASAKVAFTLKNVAIYPNPDATIPLDFSAATKTAATITGDVDANAIVWEPSAPTNVVDATLTVSGAAQLTMNADVTAHKLEVTGADLTIATDGSHKLTAVQTTIRANTIIEANAASLGTVYIPAGVTLTVNDANAVTSVTGAGTLVCEGFLPVTDSQKSALVRSVMNAATWGGTVALKGEKDFKNLDLDEYGNSTSVIELNGLGNGTNQTYMRHTQTITADVVLTGENWFTDGSSSATITFSGDISGEGSLKFKSYGNPSETWVFNGAYTASIENVDATKRKIIFGSGSAEEGKIVIAKSVTILDGKVWQAPKGVKVKSSGAIAGTGTLTSTEQNSVALTLESGATIDVTKGVVTANTLADLPAAMTVKVKETDVTLGGTIPLLNTTAFASDTGVVEGTTVTVKVGDTIIPGDFQLVKTATALSLKVLALKDSFSNAGISYNQFDKANGGGVQIDLDASSPYGLAWSAGYYQVDTVGIVDRVDYDDVKGINTGLKLAVYEVVPNQPDKWITYSRPLESTDKTSTTFTEQNVTHSMCTFRFETPVVLDATKTYKFIAKDASDRTAEIRLFMLKLNNNATQTAINYLTTNGDVNYTGYTPVVQLGVVRTLRDSLELTVPTDGTTLSKALAGDVLAENATLTINFGDKGESEATPGIFTFDIDNDDDISFAQIIVKGSNGGTITKTGAGSVAATMTTIKEGCAVTVPANTAELGAVAIESGATITVADTTTVASVTGAGTLKTTVRPSTTTGFKANTWTGTVHFKDVAVANIQNFASENSSLTLEGSKGHFTSFSVKTLTLMGETFGFQPSDGYSGPLTAHNVMTIGALKGNGSLLGPTQNGSNGAYCYAYVIGDMSEFAGALDTTNCGDRTVVWCGVTAQSVNYHDYNGKIVIDQPLSISTDNWNAVNGIVITANGSLTTPRTIGSMLTFEADATIDATGDLLTANNLDVLPSALTVKVAEAPTEGTPVTILNTSARLPFLYRTAVTVVPTQGEANGRYELIRSGETLQVAVKEDRIIAGEPLVDDEIPEQITLETETFGYGKHAVFQYMGSDASALEEIIVNGCPTDAEKVVDGNILYIVNNRLNVLPIGDSITAGLITYNGSSANWHVPGGYRLPLYQFLTQAGYEVNYLGTSDLGLGSGNNALEKNPVSDTQTHHEGHSGAWLNGSSKDVNMLDRFKTSEIVNAIAEQGVPDIITLHLGTNDLGNGASATDAMTRMEALLARLQELYPTTKIFVAKIIDRGDETSQTKVDDFNELLTQFFADSTKNTTNLVLTDLNLSNGTTVGLYRHDYLHPSTEGYTQMARGWFAAIEKTMAPWKATATIASVDARVANTLKVVTNQALAKDWANKTWSLTNVTVNGVTIADDLRTVTLSVSGITAGTTYTLSVDGLADYEFTAPADIHTPTSDVQEYDRNDEKERSDTTPKTFGPFKAAEWTTFAGFVKGSAYTSPIGYMPESGRAWQLESTTATAVDGVLSLNGTPLTVNVGNGRIGTTSSKYTAVMTVSNLASGDVLITDSALECTDWGKKGTTIDDMTKLVVKDNTTLVWQDRNNAAVEIPLDALGIDLTDAIPEVISITSVWTNRATCAVSVNGIPVKLDLTVGDNTSESYRGNFTIKPVAESKMKLYRLSIYEGEVTAIAKPVATINVGEGEGQYTTWATAKTGLNLADEMTSLTLNFTAADQTFTFDNAVALNLGAVTIQGEAGTIAKASNKDVEMASLSLQTNVTAPVAFYNACTGSVTAASATTVVAMNDASEATLTATIKGGVLKQVGEGPVTFAPTAAWNATTMPAKFEVANGTFVFNKTCTGWNNPPQLIVSGGTLDLNDTHTYNATDGSGYLKDVSSEPLVIMGGATASTIEGGAITPWIANANAGEKTMIKYVGVGNGGQNAPATFAANIDGVYSPEDHIRIIDVEKGAQTGGYDLAITGAIGVTENCYMKVENGQVKGTTLKKTGAGTLLLSGTNNFPKLEIAGGVLKLGSATALSAKVKTITIAEGATLDLNGQGISLTDVTISGAGQVIDSAETKGSLTLAGTSTVNGLNAEGVALVIAEGATATVTGDSTVSTIASTGSAGTLKVQGSDDSDQGKASLTLTALSTFGGTLSVGLHATLTCDASLTIRGTLQFVAPQAYLKTTNEAWVTIASGATIIPNSAWHTANMDIVAGATIDLSGAGGVTDGELKLEAVRLPAGANQGAVTVKGSRTSTIIDTESPLPEGLLVSNFRLAEDDDTLHFLLDYSEDRVALVKVIADLSERTEEERQDILLLAYMMGEAPIGEIENPDVTLLFDGEYSKAYGFEQVPVYEEETMIALNLRYFVKFGISDISNVRIQDNGSLLADVTAVVEPLEKSESVSFKDGVVVALYLEGENDPLQKKTIKKGDDDADVRQVIFENVQLPARNGTHKLTVRALKNESPDAQP